MNKFNIVNTPVVLYGEGLPFGSVYGKIAGYVYRIDNFSCFGGHYFLRVRDEGRGMWIDGTTATYPSIGKYVLPLLEKFLASSKLGKVTPYIDSRRVCPNARRPQKFQYKGRYGEAVGSHEMRDCNDFNAPRRVYVTPTNHAR